MPLPPPITDAEVQAVMGYSPEIRFSAWLALLAQGRVDVDTVAEAERKLLEPEEQPLNLNIPGDTWVYPGDEAILNPDLTGGSTLWAFRIGRAIFFTILALGVVSALRLIGRATRWMDA